MITTIEKIKLVEFSDAELCTQPLGAFDDNGGEPDGDMWLLPLDEVTPFEGMEIVTGYVINAYSGDANYKRFCGFLSRNEAYTTEKDVADAIAADERSIEYQSYRLHLLETPHGTRYWRFNDADSDESRSSDMRVSLVLEGADEADNLGLMWQSGASAIEVAEAAGDEATVASLRYQEDMRELAR